MSDEPGSSSPEPEAGQTPGQGEGTVATGTPAPRHKPPAASTDPTEQLLKAIGKKPIRALTKDDVPQYVISTGTLLPISSLRWDDNATAGQIRRLEPADWQALVESLKASPPTDYKDVTVWTSNTTGAFIFSRPRSNLSRGRA